MSLYVTAANDVRVYHVTSGKSAPEWEALARKRQSLRKNEDYRRRVDLIQDFEFPIASDKVRQTPDGKYVIATGTYPPQFRVYELAELGMKMERHVDCDIVQFHVLSDDWRKMVFLEADRTLEFYAAFGSYFKLRVPKIGRDMKYVPSTCDCLVVGSSAEMFRVNLEQGRFLAPLPTHAPENNCVAVGMPHELVAVGGDDGMLECFDMRMRESVALVPAGHDCIARAGLSPNQPVSLSALAFNDTGMTLAVGCSTGQVLLYDIRTRRPYQMQDHRYETAVRSISFHEQSRHVVSADEKTVRLWHRDTAKLMTTIELDHRVTDAYVFPDSGLISVAGDSRRVHLYFVPQMGPAPSWCSFLENLTEELEEARDASVYEDYKFVTHDELTDLGLTSLVGTNMLRASMHGYFINNDLYMKAKAVSEPFAFEQYRRERIQKKIEAEREARINVRRVSKLPAVNKELAAQLLSVQEQRSDGHKVKTLRQQRETAERLLQDDRFKAMWTDDRFAIDKTSEEYRLLHPSESNRPVRKTDEQESDEDVAGPMLDDFVAVDAPRGRYAYESDSMSDPDGEASDSGASDAGAGSDDAEGATNGGSKRAARTAGGAAAPSSGGDAGSRKRAHVRMFEVRGDRTQAQVLVAPGMSRDGTSAAAQQKRTQSMTLAERVAASTAGDGAAVSEVRGAGSKSMSFVPSSKRVARSDRLIDGQDAQQDAMMQIYDDQTPGSGKTGSTPRGAAASAAAAASGSSSAPSTPRGRGGRGGRGFGRGSSSSSSSRGRGRGRGGSSRGRR